VPCLDIRQARRSDAVGALLVEEFRSSVELKRLLHIWRQMIGANLRFQE
jgi:hypothetical protein